MNEAAEHCICTKELDHHPVASLAQGAFCPWSLCVYDAIGRFNPLELHIRHARIRYQIPHCH